ncbi:cytochrome c oxidase assembly protein [Rubellimicrobium aerolatum]|uniref:Cytochrome c oxidase assembly protein n=1 Tax=Rubellimicrobium aerolatum TaxID=490979 RepID=A0ABW0SEM1_9RHOB|nr:cytochrome c oxidase assembly protein [Rubellimicrobium aerolatum]MBP1806819.1 putative membrane protein [Rubellimicrobium aerolatum]
MSGWEGAYCGPAPSPAELLGRWNLDPVALGAILLVALWAGRNRPGAAAVAVLALALVSPLCALSSALFSARVLHHVLLVAVAAPLLALARPARTPTGAGLPFLLATAALWLWHAPGPYDAALAHKGLYGIMQISLLGTAVLFWRAAFSRPGGSGALWVLLAYMAMGLLGALLTFAPAPLYAAHAVAPLLWGLEPLADQQLGGLLMWVPAGLPFAAWGALLARRAWAASTEEPA